MIVEKLLQETANKRIFSVTFIKRSTGEVRRMNAMRGVTKGVKGVGLNYNASEKNLLTVYDMKKKGFRHINLSDVLEFKANKQLFTK
jgi:hypothetical protein